jgi:hypothetical protein
MNRHICIAILLLSPWVSWTASAQGTNATRGLDWNAFRAIGENNIFSPTRGPGSDESTEIHRTPVIRSFTYDGTVDDRAIFKGEGAPDGALFKVSDMIDGFKVMQVTLDYVKLADPDGKLIVLEEDDSMQRADEGPWTKSDQPLPLTTTETKPEESSVASAPGSGGGPVGESEILKRLRLKREQEK